MLLQRPSYDNLTFNFAGTPPVPAETLGWFTSIPRPDPDWPDSLTLPTPEAGSTYYLLTYDIVPTNQNRGNTATSTTLSNNNNADNIGGIPPYTREERILQVASQTYIAGNSESRTPLNNMTFIVAMRVVRQSLRFDKNASGTSARLGSVNQAITISLSDLTGSPQSAQDTWEITGTANLPGAEISRMAGWLLITTTGRES